MSDRSDREYFSQRLQTERDLAACASHEVVAKLHSELADLYAERLAGLEQPITRTTLRVANG